MSDLKTRAVAFLELASGGDVQKAFDHYVGNGFRHHNPYFAGDATSLAAGMKQNAKENPSKVLEVQRAIADGNLVAVHSRVRLKPEGPDVGLAHIFRFDGGRIVELWDIGQPAPEKSVNENGMF